MGVGDSELLLLLDKGVGTNFRKELQQPAIPKPHRSILREETTLGIEELRDSFSISVFDQKRFDQFDIDPSKSPFATPKFLNGT